MTLDGDVEVVEVVKVGEEVLWWSCYMTMSDFPEWSHFGLIFRMTLNRQTPVVERVKPRRVPTQSGRAELYDKNLNPAI